MQKPTSHNIFERRKIVGQQASPGQICEVLQGEKDFAESYERFLDHMYANRIDLEKTRATLG